MADSAPPTLADVLAAARALAPAPSGPPPSLADGLANRASTLLTGFVSAAVLAAAGGLWSMSSTLSSVSTKVDTVQKTITDIQADQRAADGRVSDLQAAVAKQDSRLSGYSDRLDRVLERVRILEGQKPLPPVVRIDQ